MFAQNWFEVAYQIGWAGVLAFFAMLIGHSALTHYGARWIFGIAPIRGGRLAVCVAATAVFAGVGAVIRFAVIEPDGAVHEKWEQTGYGAGFGLALAVWLILMSLRRAEPRESSN